MEAKRILLIENEAAIQQMIEAALVTSGFHVTVADDGKEGLNTFYRHPFDLVLLDIMLPEMSGWEVLQQLRCTSDVAIIVITSLFRQEYITHAAHYGADFLGKPFTCSALRKTVEAALRPLPLAVPQPIGERQADSNQIKYEQATVAPQAHIPWHKKEELPPADLQIDLARRLVLVRGQRVKLTAIEFRLLEYLVNHAGQVLTYQQILDTVWGWEYRNSTHYVHVFMSQLRQKLEAHPEEPRYLLTERGVGYFFVM